MLKVKYGKQEIQFTHKVNDNLKHAYVIVDFYEGVVLKSPPLDEVAACELVRKKARWILDKLKLVTRIPQGEIVTGSRLLYLGKRYYTKVLETLDVQYASVSFNHSKFNVQRNPNVKDRKRSIDNALDRFFRNKAVEKITPRLKKWCETTGLEPTDLKFRKLNKRWGSCTKQNEVIINYDVVKLPYSLMDYVIVHELVHVKHKEHSKEFWRVVERYIPNYKELDEKIVGMKL